jgi:hypothetical protein
VLARKDVDVAEIADERLRQKSWDEPIYAVANMPDSIEEQQKLIDDVMQGKPDIERRPTLWSPYTEGAEQVLAKATPLTEFIHERPDAAKFANEIMSKHQDGERLAGVPVIGKQGAYVIVIEPERKKPVDLIPVDPWVQPPASDSEAG